MTSDRDLELTVENMPAEAATDGVLPMLTTSFPPHARSADSVQRIMLITCAALLPAVGLAVALPSNGVRALLSILGAIAAAAATEWAIVALRDRSLPMIDASACLTGLLLALSLPPQLPLWAAPLGAVFAVGVVKMAFGGLGRNFLNPGLAGRAFCAFTFPAIFAAAAGLSIVRPVAGSEGFGTLYHLVDYSGGWLGAASPAALLLGAVALVILRIIDGIIPLVFLGTAFLLSWVTGSHSEIFTAAGPLAALAFLLTGGVPLVALFMATDPVTSPAAARSRILFGAGCGALTFAFRKFGNANDGAMYAVLFMNLMVPWFDQRFRQLPLGFRSRLSAATEKAAEAAEQPAIATPLPEEASL
jgi:electron transport complex protein RnfD